MGLRAHRLRRRFRALGASRLVRALLIVVAVLVVARIAAPYVLEWVINDRLEKLDGYRGHVEDVDLALIRGAYRLEDMRIVKTDGEVPVPFFRADIIDIGIAWSALFDGKVVARVQINDTSLAFASEESGGAGQTGGDNDWRSLGDDLIPITIERLEIHRGEIQYRDFASTPPVDVRLTSVEAVARGLSTERHEGDALPAHLDVHARAQHSGRLETHVALDPFARKPTFDLDLALESLDAPEVNDLLRAYVGVDAEDGELFLYSELHAQNGRFHGYVKPMAEGLSIFRFGEDGDFVDVLGDALVGLTEEIFENHGTDRFAARVPVSGSFDDFETDGWATVFSVLENTFIEAITHGLDNRHASR